MVAFLYACATCSELPSNLSTMVKTKYLKMDVCSCCQCQMPCRDPRTEFSSRRTHRVPHRIFDHAKPEETPCGLGCRSGLSIYPDPIIEQKPDPDQTSEKTWIRILPNFGLLKHTFYLFQIKVNKIQCK